MDGFRAFKTAAVEELPGHPQPESRRHASSFAAKLLARLVFKSSSFRSAVAAHGLRR
jgi:hypothetical protein